MLFFVRRAIFYSKNPEAAKSKYISSRSEILRSNESSSSLPSSSSIVPKPQASYIFPADTSKASTSSASSLPPVTSAVILSHLLRTGKSCSGSQAGCEKVTNGNVGEDDINSTVVTVSQKALRQGHEFFFRGYIHEVYVAYEDCEYCHRVFVSSECWASQKSV